MTGGRLRLHRKARLRFDARSGRQVLLYPERGLELSESAARIAALVAEGQSTAQAIVQRMAADHPGEPPERIEAEVRAFLRQLSDRGLLEEGE